jgi:hypothetical protein
MCYIKWSILKRKEKKRKEKCEKGDLRFEI